MRKMADENTMRRLWRYKSDLEQELDEEKLIEILGKLKRLPVTIAALQETGIGRVVNGYRKREGIVGDLARKVVSLWKSVVEAEVKTSKHRSPSQSPDNVASDAEAEDAENAETEEMENNSGNESDANSWNSFKEEERNNRRSPIRKRKHSVDSVCSQEGDSRSSVRNGNKKDKHTSLKVDSAGDYIPNQKKKQTQEHGDLVEHGNHSRHGQAAKATVHAASSKHDSVKYSSASQSKRDQDSKDSAGKMKTDSSSSGHRSISSKGDRHVECGKVDRKQRRHSLSPSEDDDDEHHEQASSSRLSSSKNMKPVPSLETYKHSSSSSSHKTSSSHKHSTNSPKPTQSSDSHMQSPSLNANSHSSKSSSSKHSSTSSSHKQFSSSNSHKNSSDSHKNSSDSHRHSSDSQKHSSSHRHSSSSASRNHSSPNEETISSRHHRPSASPSEHQKRTPEATSPEPQPSRHASKTSQNSGSSSSQRKSVSSRSQDPSADQHRSSGHKSRSSDRSGDTSTSSNLKHHSSHSGSKKSTVSDSESCTKELQDNSLTKLKDKAKHSTSRSLKDEGFSDKHSPSKKHAEKENHEKRSGSSSNKQNNSQQKSESDFKMSSAGDDENEKLLHSSLSGNKSGEIKSSSSKFTKLKPSSNHKRSRHKDSYIQPDLDLFSDAIHIKAEPSSPVRRSVASKPTGSDAIHIKAEPSSPVRRSVASKPTGSDAIHIKAEPSSPIRRSVASKPTGSDAIHIKAEPSSPVRRSASSKPTGSDAIHIKAEPSSPIHRSVSSKPTDSKSTKPQSSSSSKTAGGLPDHASLDTKVKVEAKVKVEPTISEHRNMSEGSNSFTDDVPVDTGEDSDSQQEYTKYTSIKDKKRKKVESPVQDENMSFEDFMAFDVTTAIKKGKSSVKSSTKTSSLSSNSSKDSHGRLSKTSGGRASSSATDLPSSSKTGFSVPVPPSLTVTELDILSMLPETHATYKPLRYNNYFRDEDERESIPPPLVDPEIIGTKAVTRTHVYSGRKHGITEVKPLYDLCMQVLIDNIDAIDCVGGIPYSILKPVLERCTAQQLYQLEDYNPHFLEDTDELWELLCQRDFRGSKPDELETWRELYMRRFEERELKYQKLKQTMSTSITKGQAGRKAQLAYVDTAAKPPREVLRKQKQFGTGSIVRTKHNPNMKGSSSGLRTFRPSTLVPAHDPMDDRARMVRALPPMMAKSIQMRKNMRR